MGYDYSFPALHISLECWCKTLVCGGGVLNEKRYQKGLAAKAFFMAIYNADCPKIAIENPIASSIYNLPPHSQEIQPFYFGDAWQKKTRLWLKGLPCLYPTNIVHPTQNCHDAGTWFMKGGKERQVNRAKTPLGIARAMAEQWGKGDYYGQLSLWEA